MKNDVRHQMLLVRRHLDALNKFVDKLETAIAVHQAADEADDEYGACEDGENYSGLPAE